MNYSQKAHKIRKKIVRYNTISLVNLLLKRLHVKHAGFDIANSRASVSCLMLEWTLELGVIVDAKNATEKDALKILNEIWALQDQALNLDNSDNAIFALRKFLIPQLRFQISQDSHTSFLTRFSLLIRQGRYKNYFNEKFKEETGVSLNDFLTVSLFLESLFKEQNVHFIKYSDLITYLHPAIGLDSLMKIMYLLGSNLSGLRDVCVERRNSLNGLHSSEYFLEPALISKPLLFLKDGVSTSHSFVATIGISEFALRFFKQLNHGEFKKRFTKLFEEYLSELLKSLPIDFLHEDEIKSLYQSKLPKGHSNNKVADFLIADSGNSLFIDAKGVEPSDAVLTTDNPMLMKDKLKDHLIKGVRQASETANNMSIIEPENYSKIENRYALIVTHQDFYLSDAKTLRGYLGNEFNYKLDEAINGQIEIEKIHFCSVSDFETILMVCKQAKCTVFEFLDYCIQSESKAETRKFHMTQHIKSFAKYRGLEQMYYFSDQIKLEFEQNHDSMMNLIDKSRSFWKQGIVNAPYFYQCTRRIQSLNS